MVRCIVDRLTTAMDWLDVVETGWTEQHRSKILDLCWVNVDFADADARKTSTFVIGSPSARRAWAPSSHVPPYN